MYRVFFIDDEPLVLESFMTSPVFLECGFINTGHSVNPHAAAELIKETQPDVVFTDLKMPGLNGVELMAELKRSGYTGEFVIVSAYKEFEEARRFFMTDGFDYIIKPVSEQDLQALLEKLSYKLADKKGETSREETPSPELNIIAAYLRNNITAKHTLESTGMRFNLKPNFICNLFSRHLGTTFTAYMTNIRMEEASSLLKATKKTVKEIAALCGYHDYFYFCRVFRDTYSCTPTAYRESEP
ncbi:MAG: response regulator [Defluviitaleaceae bacterium]|nr:response regulator [Defluviitaleaceae bacterium]MCL2837115.1 response regulator [Defluviitaleaceae bacterium]